MNVEATLRTNLPGLEQFVAMEAVATCAAGAETTMATARGLIIEQQGSGEKYPDLPNRSSAPGQSPVNQLGALVDSIDTDVDAMPAGVIGMDAVAGTDYATYLELGTNKMRPRPFMAPATVVGEEAAQVRMAETAERLKAFGV